MFCSLKNIERKKSIFNILLKKKEIKLVSLKMN